MKNSEDVESQLLLLDDYEEDVREAFDFYDADEDGMLDYKQTRELVEDLRLKMNKAQIRSMFVSESEERTKIDVDHLCRCLARELVQEQEAQKTADLRRAFSLMDTDHSGKITFEKLKAAAKKVGEDFTDVDLRNMISDASGGLEVNYEQYQAVLASVSLW